MKTKKCPLCDSKMRLMERGKVDSARYIKTREVIHGKQGIKNRTFRKVKGGSFYRVVFQCGSIVCKRPRITATGRSYGMR